MVRCRATGFRGKSEEFHKIGRDWFKDKEAYINYSKSGDVTYQDIFELLAEDKNMIPILKQQYTQIQQKNFDNELEKNIKKYISKNDIDVKYIYIDKNRINSFENIGEYIEK